MVMLVEKARFEVNIVIYKDMAINAIFAGQPLLTATHSGGSNRGHSRGHGQMWDCRHKHGQDRDTRRGHAYGIIHGQKQGGRAGDSDEVEIAQEPVLIDDASVAELFVYIQTTICWHWVICKVYANPDPSEFPVLL